MVFSGQSYFDQSMDGAVGAASLFATVPGDPLVTRHGSLEQSARGNVSDMGDYLNSMNNTGTTPRPRSARRTPPARSPLPDDDDEEDRGRERRDRRRERDQNDEPVGVGFRLNACETSIRDHQHEYLMQYLTDEIKRLISEKIEHGGRLDQIFGLVDQRFAEA